jgi:cell pole-organizing protein PopZ
VFQRAIQESFEPTLQKWVDANSSEVMQALKPIIREWMDDNLPPLIEAAVQKEIARAVKTRRR